MSLASAVQSAIAALDLAPADRATAELALTYARAVDAGDALEKLGPPLLSALEALGMSPRARASLAKGGNSGSTVASPLDELRARRAARANPAPDLDAAAT